MRYWYGFALGRFNMRRKPHCVFGGGFGIIVIRSFFRIGHPWYLLWWRGWWPLLLKLLVRDPKRSPKLEKAILWFLTPWGFFNGASQNHTKECGVGFSLYLSHEDYYLLKLGIGEGKNTRVKLLALWGLLYFNRLQGIDKIQMDGDSKVVVYWFDNRSKIQIQVLTPWL